MSFKYTINSNTPILVTGAAGFVGSRVVGSLLKKGYNNIRCMIRSSSNTTLLKTVLGQFTNSKATIISGNLLSMEDCEQAMKDVGVVYHLVAGRGKSFAGCFVNSVLTTKNLLEACVKYNAIKRFVNVSSFSVYSNINMKQDTVFDETCELENNFDQRYDAYAYGKIKQDELVMQYHCKHGIPYVLLRPGVVIGPGKAAIPAQVGIGTFGRFLHVGRSNRIPITYVENCADAIVLAGLIPNVEGEVFNVVDDDLPTSHDFLMRYKSSVNRIPSIYVPYKLFYLFCFFWEVYARWSEWQLPPVFNRRYCSFVWKRHHYSNRKLKEKLGWLPSVTMEEALYSYFEYQRIGEAGNA